LDVAWGPPPLSAGRTKIKLSKRLKANWPGKALDIFDQAQENDELFRGNALKKHFQSRRAHLHGSDGICADCGEAIPKKRLKANPQATRCVECQKKYERKGNN
jgi:phage/conjugal plasmid C-4 type zinc finger TraR family protein